MIFKMYIIASNNIVLFHKMKTKNMNSRTEDLY